MIFIAAWIIATAAFALTGSGAVALAVFATAIFLHWCDRRWA